MSNWSLRQKLRESVIDAVNRGDQIQVETLLTKGADVNEGTGGYLAKQTLLIIAVEKGHVEVANILVDRGADLTATVMVNKREMTALDIAKEKELNSLVKVIEKKMEANKRLISAVQEGNSDKVQLAINNGANINMLHKDEDSPQMNLLFLALSQGHIDVARTLIERGTDLHYTVSFPNQTEADTARSFAQRMNQEYVVNLIDKEMERNDTTRVENTPDKNSHIQHKPAKDPAAKSTGEIEDIEDENEDEQELQENNIETKRSNKGARASTCIVS